MRIATRPYARVIVGARVEALPPDAGQLLIIDPGEPTTTLRLTARRVSGSGQLFFRQIDRRSRTSLLHAGSHRIADGWPPHWGTATVITGPGCWRLLVRGNGVDDRLAFHVPPAQWRRHWRWTTVTPRQ